MSEFRNKFIHLTRCRGISRQKIPYIIKSDPSLERLFVLSPQEIASYFSIKPQKATKFYKDLHNKTLQFQLTKDLKQYHIITIFDSDYPELLKHIYDPPLVLYGLGNLNILRKLPMLSVIGTRKPSENAFPKIRHILPSLIQDDWVIVSGMAYGIDSYAHQITLDEKGSTIAVLGGGFEYIYPKKHMKLCEDIIRSGLVLTEYPPYIPPKQYHFPERNRIISGLSFATLVIEAKKKSGTLITVEQALEQGRDVYAMPDSPLIPQTEGCHALIQSGAKLVTQAEDIYYDWQEISHVWT